MIHRIEKEIEEVRAVENEIYNERVKRSYANPEEHIVRQDIFSVWEDYKYVIGECIYHIKNSIDVLKRNNAKIVEKYINNKSIIQNEVMWIPVDGCYNAHSYEFDALVVSFYRICEKAINDEVRRCINKTSREQLDDLQLNKNDVLYWRIKAFRNQAAHNPQGMFSNKNGEAKRFCTSTPKIEMCQVKDNSINLQTTLIDVGKIVGIEEFIKKTVSGNTNDNDVIMELLKIASISKSPKGEHKKDAMMLYPSSDILFDMNADYLDLAYEMIVYMNKVSKLFLKVAKEVA